MNAFRRFYDWTLGWAKTPYGGWALAVVSFVESSFFPIPPDLLLIPLCMGSRQKAFLYATICTAMSVLGGLFGYAIGAFAFDAVGMPILEFYGALDKYDEVQKLYTDHGFVVVFLAGFTPIPYKVITIAAGVFDLALVPFTVASLVGRAGRFFLVAGAIYLFGEKVQTLIDKWFNLLTVVFGVLLVGGFALVKFVLH